MGSVGCFNPRLVRIQEVLWEGKILRMGGTYPWRHFKQFAGSGEALRLYSQFYQRLPAMLGYLIPEENICGE